MSSKMLLIKMKHFHSILVVSFVILATTSGEEKSPVTSSSSDVYNTAEANKKLSDKRWALNDDIAPIKPSLPAQFSTPSFEVKKKAQERASFEKTFKNYKDFEGVEKTLIKALKPKPIVDTASESEKRATSPGSGPDVFGDLLVRGTESISRAINSIIDGPKKAFRQLSKGATQALNQIGAYLVGI